MLKRLYVSAAVWTTLGMLAGLYYREVTRALRFEGRTMLSVGHTHALALGMLVFLVVLALARAFALDAAKVRLWALIWNVGLAVTWGSLMVKGTLQVLGHPLATHAALPGIAGLGHITLAGGFVYLFVTLWPSVRDADRAA